MRGAEANLDNSARDHGDTRLVVIRAVIGRRTSNQGVILVKTGNAWRGAEQLSTSCRRDSLVFLAQGKSNEGDGGWGAIQTVVSLEHIRAEMNLRYPMFLSCKLPLVAAGIPGELGGALKWPLTSDFATVDVKSYPDPPYSSRSKRVVNVSFPCDRSPGAKPDQHQREACAAAWDPAPGAASRYTPATRPRWCAAMTCTGSP